MNRKIANILHLKVGSVTTTKLNNSKRDELISGIKKNPISSSYLTKTGFKDDFQADLLHHGGENKALFLFSSLTYKKINSFYDNKFDMSKTAFFGENLILSNITEEDICIGDILKIGQTKVQITQPRQPCWKLSANTNEKNMTNFIFNNGLTGWYAKVLQEGMISQNDEVILEKRSYPNLTIKKLNQIIVNPMIEEKLTLEALDCIELGRAFYNSLKKRYELKDKDEQFSYYHT
ncbi:MOSC domain-containing protein [Arcobacter caeni]|uniref:MOSC domain-containing protein n=1 Tax=Arcobacter caeni TaxID=1912877 RepID=A0A363D5B5_9BACT|nr:MOSC domain-containing protein [Arcobacter caeni]PUE66546.1 MOSC domain-containing protein [Arcobacter caeni]